MKEIRGYEGLYWINEDGIVFNSKGQKKGQKKNKDGYMRVWLSKNSKKRPFFVHRLVAIAFIEPIEGKDIVNHIDGIKDNNHVSNLEWCTRSENDKHAFRLGLRKPTCGGTSKKVAQYDLEGNFIKEYPSMTEAFRQTGVSISSISDCTKGKYKQSKGFVWISVKV